MDYLTILKYFGIKISSAIVMGIILLFYMKNKLDDKADKIAVNELKQEIKSDLTSLKKDFMQTLKEKFEESNKIMSITVDRLETVFETQNEKMQNIVDIQIKALNDHIDRLEKKQG